MNEGRTRLPAAMVAGVVDTLWSFGEFRGFPFTSRIPRANCTTTVPLISDSLLIGVGYTTGYPYPLEEPYSPCPHWLALSP